MSIVNCKVKYIRPEYNNIEEWMRDENNVYIGRNGRVFIDKKIFHYKGSEFMNPYKIGVDGDRDTVINKYRQYIIERIKEDEGFRQRAMKLKGKTLGCWCKPEACHGDSLLDIVNRLV